MKQTFTRSFCTPSWTGKYLVATLWPSTAHTVGSSPFPIIQKDHFQTERDSLACTILVCRRHTSLFCQRGLFTTIAPFPAMVCARCLRLLPCVRRRLVQVTSGSRVAQIGTAESKCVFIFSSIPSQSPTQE